MLEIKVKPIDEHNPEAVLELLNSHKSNLSTLLLQYNTIIETYLKILGISGLGQANINEVILPEIESLLSKYNCEFTEKGIYSNGKEIFSVSLNNPNTPEIIIKDGENSCEISKELVNAQRGLFLSKTIRDFSDLDENVKKNFSESARTHIDASSSEKKLFYFPLREIYMNASIAEGIELLKNVREYYKVDDKENIEIHQTFNLDTSGPTMHHRVSIDRPSTIDLKTLLYKPRVRASLMYEKNKSNFSREDLEDFLEENEEINELIILRDSIYSHYTTPYMRYGDIKPSEYIDTELFYYGESKLYFNTKNIVHEPIGTNPFRRSDGLYYEEKCKIAKEIPTIFSMDNKENRAKLYDILNLLGYSKLIDNIRTYDKKYPNNIHPLSFYMREWKNDLGISIRNYINETRKLSKTHDELH